MELQSIPVLRVCLIAHANVLSLQWLCTSSPLMWPLLVTMTLLQDVALYRTVYPTHRRAPHSAEDRDGYGFNSHMLQCYVDRKSLKYFLQVLIYGTVQNWWYEVRFVASLMSGVGVSGLGVVCALTTIPILWIYAVVGVKHLGVWYDWFPDVEPPQPPRLTEPKHMMLPTESEAFGV